MEVDSISLYRQAFAQADAGMAMLSAQGEWLAVNAAMCRLLERPADELLGTRAHEGLFDEGTRQGVAALLAAPAAARGMRQTHEATDGNGRAWRISLAALEGEGTHADAFLLQCEDDGEALRRRRHEDAAAQLQDQLVYGISHDLRAPLRGIAGFAAKLDESGAVGDAGRADLTRIRAATVRAERLVDALLLLLRAARQPLREDDVDVGLLCEWIAAELRDEDPARAADVEVAPGLFARGDEHWLKILFQQVLDNAWKFSAGRERVEILVEGAADGDRLQLAIHDRGCGFDMRYAHKLFLPFQRLHAVEQGGGNGLGLAIAQQVAQRHGGRLWARSQPGEGSTFFIELPAAAGPAGA